MGADRSRTARIPPHQAGGGMSGALFDPVTYGKLLARLGRRKDVRRRNPNIPDDVRDALVDTSFPDRLRAVAVDPVTVIHFATSDHVVGSQAPENFDEAFTALLDDPTSSSFARQAADRPLLSVGPLALVLSPKQRKVPARSARPPKAPSCMPWIALALVGCAAFAIRRRSACESPFALTIARRAS